MYIGLHVKYPLFTSDFNRTSIFTTDFSEKAQIPNFTKLRQVGAKAFHAERRTEVTKLIIAFRNFSNAPKNQGTCSQQSCGVQ